MDQSWTLQTTIKLIALGLHHVRAARLLIKKKNRNLDSIPLTILMGM